MFKFRIVSRGICLVNGKIMLCKAKKNSNFFLIGGGKQSHETLKYSLFREIQEEIGKSSIIGNKISSFINIYFQEKKVHVELNHIYNVLINDCHPSKKLISLDPKIDFFWFNTEDIGSINIKPKRLQKILLNDEY